MKIKIVSSYSKWTWYSELIGEVFQVVEVTTNGDVRIKNHNVVNSLWVGKEDFIEIEEKEGNENMTVQTFKEIKTGDLHPNFILNSPLDTLDIIEYANQHSSSINSGCYYIVCISNNRILTNVYEVDPSLSLDPIDPESLIRLFNLIKSDNFLTVYAHPTDDSSYFSPSHKKIFNTMRIVERESNVHHVDHVNIQLSHNRVSSYLSRYPRNKFAV